MERPNVHEDDRGKLYKIFDGDSGEVFVITIEPGKVRGNHYHKRKTEKFICVSGSAEIGYRHPENKNSMVLQLNANRPVIATITPQFVHNISSKDGAILVCWVSEPFNPDDTDTFAEEV